MDIVHLSMQSTTENKYILCLKSCLEEKGIQVKPLHLPDLLWKSPVGDLKNQVVHFQWINYDCGLEGYALPELVGKSAKFVTKVLLLKCRGYRLVWTVHNKYSHNGKHRSAELWVRKLFAGLCDAMIVMSRTGKSEIASEYKISDADRIHVVRHGNYVGCYPNTVRREAARARFGFLPDQQVFGFVGQIRAYKGLEDLIDAFMKSDNEGWRLLIAGKCLDESSELLVKKAAEKDSRITFVPGFVPDEELQLYLGAIDWLVLPYKEILNSGSVLLSYSFSRPVIAPAIGALVDEVHDGIEGFVYQGAEELPRTLERAAGSGALSWEAMCRNALQRAQSANWSDLANELIRVYGFSS